MHLLLDARLLHRPLSGLERVQRNLLRELARHPEIQRLQVLVKAGTRLPADFPERAEVIEVNDTEDILAVLLHEDPEERPDLYHLSWFPDRNPRDVLLMMAAKVAVLEVHDAILNRHPEYHPSMEAWAWYHRFVCGLVKNCDRILVHSKSVRKEVVRDLDGDASIVDIAPLAVDPVLLQALTEAEVTERLSRLGVGGDYFVAVGKDYPHKDHATMFGALARLPSSVRVVVAGEKVWHQPGESTDELLRSLGIPDSVSWKQGLPDDDIKALLQGSKGLVFPSLEEGFGLPPIEAMALGVPVVAAASTSIPEVCGDGALLFEPGNVDELVGLMQKMLAGGPEIEAVRERGRKRAATYSWERCADAVVECYGRARELASAGKKEEVSRGLLEVLQVIASWPHGEAVELAAWQERCRAAESHARDVEGNRDDILRQLRDLQAVLAEMRAAQEAAQEAAPQALPAHQAADNGRPRPCWSLRRRIGKIRRALRERFGWGVGAP